MTGNLLTAATALGATLALGGWHWALLYDTEDAAALRHYCGWAIKGLAVPLAVWTLFNSGLVPGVPSLSTDIELARSAGASPVGALMASMGKVVLIVTGCWLAATYAWMLGVLIPRLAAWTDTVALAFFIGIPALPIGWAILRFGGWGACGWAAALWLVPTLHLSLPLNQRRPIPPSYSRAQARLKFGKFAAAEQEVLRELERCQDDFEGWMMLADIYANQFGEVLEADLVVRELCEQPNLSGARISFAFHCLADWYLKRAEDPTGAREALATIVHKLPDTHFARMAQQRIDQLPRSREALREQREHKPLRLPALKDPLDEAASPPPTPGDRAEAARRAEALVERLREDPNNVAAREELAVVFAERLDKVDLGVEQLEDLLGMPDQPQAKAAHWLSLIAAWRIRYRQDWAAAVPVLDRLVRDYPQTPQGFTAQRHLKLREVELRLRRAQSGSVGS